MNASPTVQKKTLRSYSNCRSLLGGQRSPLLCHKNQHCTKFCMSCHFNFEKIYMQEKKIKNFGSVIKGYSTAIIQGWISDDPHRPARATSTLIAWLYFGEERR